MALPSHPTVERRHSWHFHWLLSCPDQSKDLPLGFHQFAAQSWRQFATGESNLQLFSVFMFPLQCAFCICTFHENYKHTSSWPRYLEVWFEEWKYILYSRAKYKTVSGSENGQLLGQRMMVFLLGFKLFPESPHMSVVWPPHSCALVQAIRPLGTSLLKGWEDTSAPLMAARSNRWAPNSPLNKQRRHCVEKQHSSNNKNMNKKQQQIGSKDQWGGTNEKYSCQ